MTTYLGKSCSFCLPRVPFVNCRQFMYFVISLLVLRAGYGIWLYQFLIIAYLFTLLNRSPGHWLLGSKYMKKSFSISRQYVMGAVVKYSYHLLFWGGTVSLACLNTSIFHWKNRQNRLKIENLGCHGNGHADWRKGSIFIHHWTSAK